MKVERVPKIVSYTEHDIQITLEREEAYELLIQLNVLHGHYLKTQEVRYPHPKMLTCADLQNRLFDVSVTRR